MDFFERLQEYFPDKDPDIIEDIINLIEEQNEVMLSEDEKLNYMVNMLTETGGLEQYDEAVGGEYLIDENLTLDSIMVKLIAAFPKADPSFLEEKAREWLDENSPSEKLDGLLVNLLETKLPPIEEYYEREEQAQLYAKYTTNFKLDVFIEEFNDPIKYFLNKTRVHSLTPKSTPDETLDDQINFAKIYLYNTYPHLYKRDIDKHMEHYKNDIVTVCSKLDELPRQTREVRPSEKLPETTLKNLMMFKELAFGCNRKLLKRCLDLQNTYEQELFKEAVRENMLQTCESCYDSEVIPQNCLICDKGCIFCKYCVKLGAETAFSDGKVNFPCFNNCGEEFRLSTIRKAVDANLYKRIDEKRQAEEIQKANLDGYETCLFCDYGYIPEPNSKIFHCQNHHCMKEICRECKHEAHYPKRCNEVEYDEDVKIRTFIENKMTEGLIRICNNCKKKIVKSSGCNKLTCVCGHKMCYICKISINDYSHFNSTRCQLFTNDHEEHIKNVMTAAEKAKQELGIDLDPTKLKFDPTENIEHFIP